MAARATMRRLDGKSHTRQTSLLARDAEAMGDPEHGGLGHGQTCGHEPDDNFDITPNQDGHDIVGIVGSHVIN